MAAENPPPDNRTVTIRHERAGGPAPVKRTVSTIKHESASQKPLIVQLKPTGTANAAIAVSMIGTAIVISAPHLEQGNWPPPHTIIGVAFVFVILGFASSFVPSIAALLAVLVFVTALLAEGQPFFNLISKLVGKQTPPNPTKKQNIKKVDLFHHH